MTASQSPVFSVPIPRCAAFVGFGAVTHDDLAVSVFFEPFHAGYASAHVAANINDFKIGAQGTYLCGAAR